VQSLDENQIRLTKYLVQYYRHSFRVRAGGSARRQSLPDTPIVMELKNLLFWMGNGMETSEKMEHMLSMIDVISIDSAKLKEVMIEVERYGITERAEETINEYMSYLRAADKLTEVISAQG